MKKEILDVYERPEVEEVKLVIEPTCTSGCPLKTTEDPVPYDPTCPEKEIVL